MVRSIATVLLGWTIFFSTHALFFFNITPNTPIMWFLLFIVEAFIASILAVIFVRPKDLNILILGIWLMVSIWWISYYMQDVKEHPYTNEDFSGPISSFLILYWFIIPSIAIFTTIGIMAKNGFKFIEFEQSNSISP